MQGETQWEHTFHRKSATRPRDTLARSLRQRRTVLPSRMRVPEMRVGIDCDTLTSCLRIMLKAVRNKLGYHAKYGRNALPVIDENTMDATH